MLQKLTHSKLARKAYSLVHGTSSRNLTLTLGRIAEAATENRDPSQ